MIMTVGASDGVHYPTKQTFTKRIMPGDHTIRTLATADADKDPFHPKKSSASCVLPFRVLIPGPRPLASLSRFWRAKCYSGLQQSGAQHGETQRKALRATPHQHAVRKPFSPPLFPSSSASFVSDGVSTRSTFFEFNCARLPGKSPCLTLCGRVTVLSCVFSIRSSYGGSARPLWQHIFHAFSQLVKAPVLCRAILLTLVVDRRHLVSYYHPRFWNGCCFFHNISHTAGH